MSLKRFLKGSWRILSSPSPATFQELTRGSKGVFGGSMAWSVGWSGLAIVILGLAGFWEGIWLGQLFLGVVLVPLWLLVFVYLQHYLTYKIFRVKPVHYDDLLVANSLILGLILAFTTLTALLKVPFWLANPLLGLYMLVLVVLGITGITGVRWWQATLIAIFSGLLGLGGLIVGGVLMLSLIQVVPSLF